MNNTQFKIAWRNIWRNKWRTMLTVSAVFFAVLISSCMRAMQLGMYDNMIKTVVELESGHIQIHGKGYWDEKTIDNSLFNTEELSNILNESDKIDKFYPKLEAQALVSSGELTKGAFIFGCDLELEDTDNKLSRNIIDGYLPKKENDGVAIGSKLATYLNVKTGDTIFFIGQGYFGVSAYGKYVIKGIIDLPNPKLDRVIVYMPLLDLQKMCAAENRLTSISILLKDKKYIDPVQNELLAKLDSNEYEVMNWREMQKELVQQIESDNGSGIIFLGILYMIIGFIIFGTVLMIVNERKKEFAVMVAVGLQKSKLGIVFTYEMIFTAFIGAIAGIIVAYFISLYFHFVPILMGGEFAEMYEKLNFEPLIIFSIEPMIFINQAIIVLIITLFTTLYAVKQIRKLNVIKSIRN